MAGHPLNGTTFGVPGTITPLIDVGMIVARVSA
jgi:hypothetical protein